MSIGMVLINMVIALAIIMFLIIKFNINAAISLFIGGLYMGIATNMGFVETVNTFTSGFGGIMGGLGLSIGFGVIMGQLLSDAGGAYVIAKKMVSLFPKEKAIMALILTSFIISIPVFFDVTLIIMIPIAFAVAKEIGAPRSIIACALVAGAGSAHSYVPPTPAPLAAAEILNFSLGPMIIVGSIVSLIGIVTVYPLMKYLLWPKGRESKFFTDKDLDPDFIPIKQGNYDQKKLPSFSIALLPIILPVVLILITSTWAAVSKNVPPIINFIGNKNVALLIGALISYIIAYGNMTKSEISKSVNKALETSGVVLLITGAGGAFGNVIKSTGIGDMINELIGTSSDAVIPVIIITFIVGVVFRVCMGSASSAGITALTIMSPVVASITTVHPVWFAMAGLSGCNMIGLVNDSGFWVSTNLNGFTVTGGLKTYTVFGAIRAVIILLVCIIGSQIFPLA